MKAASLLFILSSFQTWSSSSAFGPSTFGKSSFAKNALVGPRQQRMTTFSRRGTMLMYDMSKDPPASSSRTSDNYPNMWTVLANTEQWIQQILSSQSSAAGENPYTRKEVSYVCETSHESAMIVAGIFRRLRESRELGEAHGVSEEERLLDRGEKTYRPSTLRQTLVMVIPSSDDLQSFPVFDQLIEQINHARRNARDYVTDIALEKLDDRMYGESEERDWLVSVNCAHLHPKFGEKTSEEVLKELKEEEQSGEVDLNLKVYKEKRLLARRSPYPTVVIEVRATPPPNFGESQPPKATAATQEVTSADIQRLEALFGKSAHMSHPSKEKSRRDEEEDFYDAIGKTIGVDAISLVTPIILAQNWISEHVDGFDPRASAFTATDAKHVDEAYEFVFTNVAMQTSKFLDTSRGETAPTSTQYLVMSNFVTSSATSFEKFSQEVASILDVLPALKGQVEVSTLHPEHVDSTKRSPVPVCVLKWLN